MTCGSRARNPPEISSSCTSKTKKTTPQYHTHQLRYPIYMTSGSWQSAIMYPAAVNPTANPWGNMRNLSQMLPLQIIILVSAVVSPSMGLVTDDKCKCFMCVCDVDPHPLPPALPSHHHPPPPSEPEPTPEYYPPPSEPEPTPGYYPPPSEPEPTPECNPPPSEPEPTPEYYIPPPAEPYEYPWGSYEPPAPVLGIVGTPGQMYPRDKSFNPSGAHRRRCHGLSSLILAFSLISGVVSLLMSI